MLNHDANMSPLLSSSLMTFLSWSVVGSTTDLGTARLFITSCRDNNEQCEAVIMLKIGDIVYD